MTRQVMSTGYLERVYVVDYAALAYREYINERRDRVDLKSFEPTMLSAQFDALYLHYDNHLAVAYVDNTSSFAQRSIIETDSGISAIAVDRDAFHLYNVVFLRQEQRTNAKSLVKVLSSTTYALTNAEYSDLQLMRYDGNSLVSLARSSGLPVYTYCA